MTYKSIDPNKMFPRALIEVEKALVEGAKKHTQDDWCYLSCDEHLRHAFFHIGEFENGDDSEDHLTNCAVRALMALEIHIERCR